MSDNERQLRRMVGPSSLTKARLIATNVVWNVIGDGAPILLALVAIPILIDKLGISRFGILTIAWTMLGYMALFDLGLSRAMTKLVAAKVAIGQFADIPSLFWLGNSSTLVFGLIGAVLLAIASPPLAHHALNIPKPLQGEALSVFYALAVGVPVMIVASSLQGFLAAFQRFDLITAVRVPTAAALFICPLVVLPFSRSLVAITVLLLITRSISCLVNLLLCLHVCPRVAHELRVNRKDFKTLLTFGGWVSVSNVIQPFMLYCDRFLVGAFLPISAVAYYATTYDVITKLIIVPSAIARAFFPPFAESLALNRARTLQLLNGGTDLILLIIAPIVLMAVTIAPEALKLWLGPSFAIQSASVLRWLAIGVLVNSVAHLPFTLVQAGHRPDITAKFHMAELPVYLIMFCLLIRWRGIEGAAMAWSARLALDTMGCWLAAYWILPEAVETARRASTPIAVSLMLVGVGAYLDAGLIVKSLFLLPALSAGGLASWLYLLTPEEKERVSRPIAILQAFASKSS